MALPDCGPQTATQELGVLGSPSLQQSEVSGPQPHLLLLPPPAILVGGGLEDPVGPIFTGVCVQHLASLLGRAGLLVPLGALAPGPSLLDPSGRLLHFALCCPTVVESHQQQQDCRDFPAHRIPLYCLPAAAEPPFCCCTSHAGTRPTGCQFANLLPQGLITLSLRFLVFLLAPDPRLQILPDPPPLSHPGLFLELLQKGYLVHPE